MALILPLGELGNGPVSQMLSMPAPSRIYCLRALAYSASGRLDHCRDSCMRIFHAENWRWWTRNAIAAATLVLWSNFKYELYDLDLVPTSLCCRHPLIPLVGAATAVRVDHGCDFCVVVCCLLVRSWVVSWVTYSNLPYTVYYRLYCTFHHHSVYWNFNCLGRQPACSLEGGCR
jgi:hypothetical protein